MNINRILTGAMCAIAILSASGCPRRVPTEPEPPTPAPVVEPGPTDPVVPAPGPNPNPNPNPVVTPVPAPVVTPTPAPQVTPTPKPEPTDEPEPEPTDEQIFAELIRTKMGHYRVDRAINEMRSQMFLRADGWTKGQYETPEEYSANMFEEVSYTFKGTKQEALTYEQYLTETENFSVTSLIANQHIYYVDLKRSVAGEEFYILRYSPETKEVIGVKTGVSDYIPNLPTASGVNTQFNRLSSNQGKVFFYALERRTNFLDNEQRFIRIPEMFFFTDWEDRYQSQAVEQQRVHQQRVYQQRVAQQQFNAQRRAPVYTNTGYPQQSGY